MVHTYFFKFKIYNQYKPKPIDIFDCHKQTHATAIIKLGTDIADIIRYIIFNIYKRFTFD